MPKWNCKRPSCFKDHESYASASSCSKGYGFQFQGKRSHSELDRQDQNPICEEPPGQEDDGEEDYEDYEESNVDVDSVGHEYASEYSESVVSEDDIVLPPLGMY